MTSQTQVWDKVKTWKLVLALVAEELDFGLLSLIQNNAYLDSLEGTIAKIGCKSYTMMEILQRKRVREKLEPIFSAICGFDVIVQFVQGRPRIIPKPSSTPSSVFEPQPGSELEALHAQYGDIMGIVDRHPTFMKASRSIEKGGWGIFKGTLTRYCKDYGVLTVLEGLRETASQPMINKPRAYFVAELKRGRWGHKLTITPSLTGPQLQSM